MALVHCLPPELLVDIVFILHDDIPKKKENGFSATWIHATWVCRRWREAALQNRRLWTKFSTRRYVLYPEAIHAFLSRASDTARVEVSVDPVARLGEDEEPIREDIGRADALEYLYPWRDRMDLTLLFTVEENSEQDPRNSDQHTDIDRLLGTLGTALTFLWLGARLGGDPLFNRLILHAHRLPNLHKIFLNTVPFACDPLPGVTFIMLYKVALWGHGYLQDFLETCPNAEEIVIYKWRALDIMAAPAHLPFLYLERLTNLQLSTAPTESIGDVLALFRLVPSASFELDPDDTDPDAVRRLLRCDAWLRESLFYGDLDNLPTLSSTHMLEVKTQRLLQDDSRDPGEAPQENPLWVYLYGRAGSEPCSEPHWKVQSCLQGGVSLMAQNLRYLGRFLCGLPLIVQSGLIRELALQFPDWLSAGFRRQSLWRELFGSFHALEHLLLCGWTFIEAATRTLEADHTLFPLLKSLYICISRPPSRADAHMAMMRWLAARREMGLPLEAVELRVGKSVSPQTAAWAAQLLDAAKAAELALQIELRDGGMCDVCERPTGYRQELLEADDSPDARPGAGAGDNGEWAESDGEDGGSESDYEAHSGSDNNG